MKFSRALAIAKKETFHIARDPFTLALALLLPVIMVAIFGLAIEYNVRNIKIAVYDGDQTQSSRRLLDTLGSSGYFIIARANTQRQALDQLESDKARAALIINRRFERELFSGNGAQAQLILDGSDNSTIGSILSYFAILQKLTAQKMMSLALDPEIQLTTRFLYNPELNSRWFTVPGLMVVVLAILSILLTSLTVSREWENGSMELLLSTPVEPLEIIIGKLLPYVFLGLGAILFVYLVARLGFSVPFRGSHGLFFLGSCLFLATYLAQGLLISVTTRSQQLSMQFAMMSGLLPSLLLSGFTFPIESMPVFFQRFTMILPARWFMVISRDIFLKGAGLQDLKTPFLALTLICLVMVTFATKKFKKDLES